MAPREDITSGANPALARTTEFPLKALNALSPFLFGLFGSNPPQEIRRDWKVNCGDAEFDIMDSNKGRTISITIQNNGNCNCTLKFTDDDKKTENKDLRPGVPTTYDREDIIKISIKCGEVPAAPAPPPPPAPAPPPAPHECKGSYTLIKS